MCVWCQLRACCDYLRNNVPIQLLYVCDSTPRCIISGFRPISQIFTTHAGSYGHVWLWILSSRRDICYETSNIFMIAYSKILTQSDTSATTVSNELTSNQAPNLRRALYLVSLTGCYVESTSAPLQHAWAINHCPHPHRQLQTGTKHRFEHREHK